MDQAFIQASVINFALHLAYAVVALFVGAGAIWVLDKIFLKHIKLEEEIAKGNLAAAIYAGAIWIALALILTLSG